MYVYKRTQFLQLGIRLIKPYFTHCQLMWKFGNDRYVFSTFQWHCPNYYVAIDMFGPHLRPKLVCEVCVRETTRGAVDA